MKQAIVAALLAARRHGDGFAPEGAVRLCDAWENALFAAFDAARPPGRLEFWARGSLPRMAAYFRVARLETTSPRRSDAIHLSAVAIFESRRCELRAQD